MKIQKISQASSKRVLTTALILKTVPSNSTNWALHFGVIADFGADVTPAGMKSVAVLAIIFWGGDK